MKKILLPTILLSFLLITCMAQNKPKLIYFGDPMCSWCYGFSPEFTKAVESLQGEFDFQLVMGGLRPYNTETMEDLGDFLKEHWEHVAERSGQPFKHDILQDKTFVYDTEPACRAVVTMRKLKPEVEFEFFKAIQTAFYAENKNVNITSTFVELATTFGLDKEVFKAAFESAEMKQKVKEDFAFSANSGVTGFPTVVVDNGTQLIKIASGYAAADLIIERTKAIKK